MTKPLPPSQRSPKGQPQDVKDRIVALWNEGKSSGNIAKLLDLTRNIVTGIIHRDPRCTKRTNPGAHYKRMVQPHNKRRVVWSPELDQLLRNMWGAGKLASEMRAIISAKVGFAVSYGAVETHATKMQLRRPEWFSLRRRTVAPVITDMRDYLNPKPLPNEPVPIGPENDFPERGCCRFTRDDVSKPGWRMCGHPAQEGHAWCLWHMMNRIYNHEATARIAAALAVPGFQSHDLCAGTQAGTAGAGSHEQVRPAGPAGSDLRRPAA